MRHGHENVDVVMNCDVAGCERQVRRAPRIVVPSVFATLWGHRPIKVMTTLHYCDAHVDAFGPAELAAYWTDKMKAAAEDIARVTRPIGFKPDFERATVELVLVTTPEYRAFLKQCGFRRVVA